MLNRLVIGTLTTLNTMVTPLGSSQAPNPQPVYKLDVNESLPEDRCAGAQQSFLVMRIDDGPDAFITLHVQGHLCSLTSGLHPVAFATILPADLLDEEFLEKLPVQSSYVSAGVPSLKRIGTKLKVKITKLPAEGDRVPLQVMWLPDNQGRTEHRPMTIWMKKSLLGTSGMPWLKVEFSELEHQVIQPMEIAGQIQVKVKR